LELLQHVHPKDPCIQFENKKRSLGEYYKALTFILANKYIIIRDSKITKVLENAQNKVIDCESLKLVYTKNTNP